MLKKYRVKRIFKKLVQERKFKKIQEVLTELQSRNDKRTSDIKAQFEQILKANEERLGTIKKMQQETRKPSFTQHEAEKYINIFYAEDVKIERLVKDFSKLLKEL